MNAFEIRESQVLSVSLTPDQADALNALGRDLASKKLYWGSRDDTSRSAERALVRCSPGAVGKYDVTVDNAVGVIGVGDIQLSVRPKIGLHQFLYLLDYVRPLPRSVRERIALQSADDLGHIVVGWFLDALFRLLRGDLLRDYRETEERVQFVRGTVELAPSARLFYGGTTDLLCRFDEFDQDTPLNRILKAAAERVLTIPTLDETLKSKARRALSRFVDVGMLQRTDLRVEPDRRTRAYSEAIGFAKWVLSFLGLSNSNGKSAAYCFLFPTAALAEEAIRRVLAIGLQGLTQVKKYGRTLKGSFLTVNPDIIFEQTEALGDVKYKVTTNEWNRADLYQTVAFAAAFGFVHGAVLSFARDDDATPPVALFNDIAITNIAWRIGRNTSPQTSERRFLEDVRAWLSTARLLAPTG